MGKRLAVKKDYAAAMPHLTELVEKWNLRPDIYKEAVEMLLDIHLEIGPPAKIVHYFEIIKEKWPNEEIPFAKIVKVGAAYHEMGEYERSYLVFRATVESNFARESEVAGFLQSQGELLRSVEAMSGLLRNYPPEGYVAAATYALAQQVSAKAPEAATDAKLRQQKVNRVDLLRRAWTMLEGFLTAWPDDPAADQAAFASASTLLDLKAYREAAAACDRYAKRYAQSDLVDSYWYIIGYCEFATGRHKAALEMCRKVAESKRLDKTTGREVESPNKWQAIYILGQVYHGLGEAADAIREYRRVEDRFADAREAIAYFLHKSIDLPEVTTIKPGEAAEVELKFRNLAALRREGLSHRPDEVQSLAAEPGRHRDHQPGRHPPAARDERQARRRQGLSRSHAEAGLAARGRRGLPRGLPRRRPARQRPGAGHAAGRRDPGGCGERTGADNRQRRQGRPLRQ